MILGFVTAKPLDVDKFEELNKNIQDCSAGVNCTHNNLRKNNINCTSGNCEQVNDFRNGLELTETDATTTKILFHHNPVLHFATTKLLLFFVLCSALLDEIYTLSLLKKYKYNY